jgi:precorrin-2/cobalt-factor-2 C20-methyltransferase
VRKTSVYLPEQLKAALAGRAAATGRSEAELIRESIAAALAAAPSAAPSALTPPRPGRLVGVGVGPGEADLLTGRAVVCLRRADRVVAPTTAVDAIGRAEAVVREAVPGLRVERIAFSMAPGPAARDRSLAGAAAVVARHLDAGEEVAWITLGDPLTYSTFAAVAERVRAGRPETIVEQVPGIMAFQALAARTGTVIAGERTRVTLRTALDGEDVTGDLADPATTVVMYKGGRRLPELARSAGAAGRSAGAVAGELLGMPGERVGALADLADAGPASYLATVIVPAAACAPGGPLTGGDGR